MTDGGRALVVGMGSSSVMARMLSGKQRLLGQGPNGGKTSENGLLI